MQRFNTNNARLFFKGLVTAWVPVAVLMGVVTLSTESAVVIMGASTFTIDGAFWMFGVGDAAPNVPQPQMGKGPNQV